MPDFFRWVGSIETVSSERMALSTLQKRSTKSRWSGSTIEGGLDQLAVAWQDEPCDSVTARRPPTTLIC